MMNFTRSEFKLFLAKIDFQVIVIKYVQNAKHFDVDNFKINSNDTRINRRNSRESQILQRQRFKPIAIPRLSPNLATYLSLTPTTSRFSFNSTSTARLKVKNSRMQCLYEAILFEDSVSNLNGFKKELNAETWPKGFFMLFTMTA